MSYFYNISENVQLRKQDDKVVNVPEKNDYIHQQHSLCDYRMREPVSSTGKADVQTQTPSCFYFIFIFFGSLCLS